MEVYGLTGGIGSGKSTVAEMLEEYGIPVVSADELSRMVVAPGSRGLADVVEAFGPEVLDDKGELDRKKMGRIVFTTPERRRQLEAILHPRIRERYEQVLDALEKAGHPVMVYEVPLLFEKKLDQQDEMKGVILVTASTDTRIARVKARDTLTTDDVLARMRAQMPEQEKRQRADYIVHNDGDLDDLRREVEHLISRFLRMPPRSLDNEYEAERELEIDESEIDTLSPEEVVEEAPTAEMDLSLPDAELEVVAPELEISLASPPQSELEVELSPVSTPAPSIAPPPTPVPLIAPPPAVGAPTPVVPTPTPVAPSPVVPAPPASRPNVAGPSVAGPSGAGPSVAGPSVAGPSVAGPSVAPPPPAVATLAAPPVVAQPGPLPAPPPGPPRPPRPRVGTVPQMSVPFVREKPNDDGEESPT